LLSDDWLLFSSSLSLSGERSQITLESVSQIVLGETVFDSVESIK
jgi:hypothetical protein